MVDRAQRQTMPVPRQSLRYDSGLKECLNELEQRRVLRVRSRDTADEEWQLYHSYLAGAVLALEKKLAKWPLYLKKTEEEYRKAAWVHKWTELIPPTKQLALFWNRLKGRFRYGEHAAFALASAARLLVNSVTVTAVIAFFVWSWSSTDVLAEEFLNEYDAQQSRQQALWKLADAKQSVKARFFEKALSRPATMQTLDREMAPAIASLGFWLRAS